MPPTNTKKTENKAIAKTRPSFWELLLRSLGAVAW
jgi:hypothetical protein